MKKMIALILSLCLIVLSIDAMAADSASVSVAGVSMEPGEIKEVTVSIAGNPGMAAWMFEVSWDTSALTLETSNGTVEIGSDYSAGTILAKQTECGLTASWYSIRDVKADGVLFTFRLKASPTAEGNYPIDIRCSAENTINTREDYVNITVADGFITIPTREVPKPGLPDEPVVPGKPVVPSQPDQNTEASDNPVPSKSPFRDVPNNSYYYDAVLWAVEHGITGGTTATTFSPQTVCTRAQMVTFLWRAAGSPNPVVMGNSFNDVDRGSYYAKAVAWTAENGITSGTTATTFSPQATVSRAQVATFLWRAFGDSKVGSANIFEDVPQGAYYADAVGWAVENGITSGTTATTFNPAAECTRSQIVTFLYRNYLRDNRAK